MARTHDPADRIPLNPRDYLILFALVDGPRHGYGILKDVERGGVRIDPANLYRSIKRLTAEGLIEPAEAPADAGDDDRRRRYCAVTAFGREVVKLEAARLAALTTAARARRLVPEQGSS